jgi:glycine/D-amino acid oxidase-like deaminating enzyme
MKVVVVGAGVIGASIALALSRAGIAVTVVDAGLPAASSTSFGWINASFYADTAHHRLRAASLEAYGRLMRVLPTATVSTCGALWWEAQGEALTDMQTSLNALGYPVEKLTREQAETLEPDINGLPPEVLRFPNEGCADVASLADAMLHISGARVVSGVRVNSIALTGGAVSGVETTIGRIDADQVVVAAGNGAPSVLETVGVKLPMLTRPGLLVTTKPVTARIRSIMVTPHGEARQLSDGRILASAVVNHQGDESSEVTETAEDIAVRVLGWLEQMIAGENLEWDRLAFAYRPVPQDGLPVIGASGPNGLHIAVMHSGVTLAAIVGEAVAAEVRGQGGYDVLLSPYRPYRFQ